MRKFLLHILLILLMVSLSVSAFAAEDLPNQEIKIYVNDTKIQFDVPPAFIQNRTMVPIRAVFEAMGAIVEWNNDTKTVTITRGTIVQVQLDNRRALINGKPVMMEVPATGLDGRILVPLRFIGEALEAEVEWVNSTKTAFVNDISEQKEDTGNIQNWGRFVTDGEWNYFIIQTNVLVRENTISKEQEKLSDHIVSDLHIIDDWIYCIGMDQGIQKVVRLKKDGTEKEVFINEPINAIQIVNDWIYYGDSEKQTSLFRTKTDGTGTMRIVEDGNFSPKNWLIRDGWVFFQNYRTNAITRVRIDGSESTTLTNLFVYPTPAADRYSQNTSTPWSIKMIDTEYLYLVLEIGGYDFANYYDSGIYRIPINGGNPQLILDKIPISLNMDDDWIYMSVKNQGKTQLIKYKKNGKEVLTINEYKENDIPGNIYLNRSSIYYTLLRGSGEQEELLFQMNSNGESILPVNWKYGQDYEDTKEILSAVASAHQSLDSLTTVLNAEMDIEEGIRTVTIEHKRNKTNSLYYQKTTEEGEPLFEIWVDSGNVYSKKPEEKHWSINDPEINLTTRTKSIFDYIQPSDELCNNLLISEQSGKLILHGTGSFPGLMGNLKESNAFVINDRTDFIDSVTLDIVIDDDTMLIEQLALDLSYHSQDERNIEKHSRYEYTNSRFNSTSIGLPSSLYLSVTAKKQADYNTDKALQKLKEGNYQEAIKYFDLAIGLYNKSHTAYLYKGNAQYKLGNYKEAVLTYQSYYELIPSDIEVLSLQGICYLKLGDLNKAEQLAQRVLSSMKDSISALNLLGSVAEAREEYHEALELFQKAVSLDSENYDSHLNLVTVLFNMGSYSKCINTADEFLQRFTADRELMFLKAQSLSRQGKSGDAIRVYEQILELSPTNDFVAMTYIAMEYENLQNYLKAQEYADKAKAVYPDYDLLKHLLEKLAYDRSTTSAQKLVNFIRDYYLYYRETDEVDKLFEDMIKKRNYYSIQDVEKLIEAVKTDEDTSTFIISGAAYDAFIGSSNQSVMEARQEGGTIFIGLKTFSQEIGIKFTEFIQNIPESQEKVLILDLRDNAGELSNEANTMLDALLPACTTSYLIERDGYITTFYSDKSHTRFKKIGILVNEKTASSSELLALGLKTYGENVTIIGRKTRGKGVGQIIYLDRANEYAIFLVNHYWNVLQKNIHEEGLPIDIEVGDDDPDFSKAIQKFLESE